MAFLTYACMGINVLVAVVLVIMLFNPNQDAAGKGLLGLPILALLACAGLSWLLMNKGYPVGALLLAGIPAVIALYVAVLTFKSR